MRLLINHAVVAEDSSILNRSLMLLHEDALFLRGSYPCFDSWLLRKVIPGIMQGERSLIIELRADRIAGFMILKHSKNERKLCTLRVRPDFESRGIGVRLFNEAFEALQTTRPLLTVSETNAPKFEMLFRYFGFSKEATYENLYVPRVRELAFNGLLDVAPPTERYVAHNQSGSVVEASIGRFADFPPSRPARSSVGGRKPPASSIATVSVS